MPDAASEEEEDEEEEEEDEVGRGEFGLLGRDLDPDGTTRGEGLEAYEEGSEYSATSERAAADEEMDEVGERDEVDEVIDEIISPPAPPAADGDDVLDDDALLDAARKEIAAERPDGIGAGETDSDKTNANKTDSDKTASDKIESDKTEMGVADKLESEKTAAADKVADKTADKVADKMPDDGAAPHATPEVVAAVAAAPPVAAADDDDDDDCVVTFASASLKAEWVHEQSGEKVTDVIKGALLIDDVYGPARFIEMTMRNARVRVIFMPEMTVSNQNDPVKMRTQGHLRKPHLIERDNVNTFLDKAPRVRGHVLFERAQLWPRVVLFAPPPPSCSHNLAALTCALHSSKRCCSTSTMAKSPCSPFPMVLTTGRSMSRASGAGRP